MGGISPLYEAIARVELSPPRHHIHPPETYESKCKGVLRGTPNPGPLLYAVFCWGETRFIGQGTDR